jgi:hypothetical protein
MVALTGCGVAIHCGWWLVLVFSDRCGDPHGTVKLKHVRPRKQHLPGVGKCAADAALCPHASLQLPIN